MRKLIIKQLKTVLDHAIQKNENAAIAWTPKFTIVWNGEQLYKIFGRAPYVAIEMTITELQKILEEY